MTSTHASGSGEDLYEPIEPRYQSYQDGASPDRAERRDEGGERRALLAGSGVVPIPTREDAEAVSMYLQVESNEIFVEAVGTRSLPQVFELSMLIYTEVKKWTYIILTTLLAIFLAILWGLTFAILSFLTVWVINPVLRLFYIIINIWARAWAVGIHASFDPCYLSAALFLSRIRVTVIGSAPKKPLGAILEA